LYFTIIPGITRSADPGSYAQFEPISLLDTFDIIAVCMNDINQGGKFAVLEKYKKYIYGKTVVGRIGRITVL
jgi:hypothetical protein